MDWAEIVEISGTRDYPDEMLSFTLPPFARLCWASSEARQTWIERFQRVAKAWFEIEWMSVVHGLRDCALLRISNSSRQRYLDLLAHHNLTMCIIPPHDQDPGCSTSNDGSNLFAVGSSRKAEKCMEAWIANDAETVGTLVGYPPCCTQGLSERFLCGDVRSIWSMVSETSCKGMHPEQTIHNTGYVATNMFWSRLGVRAVPHQPCRFSCSASPQIAASFANLGTDTGFSTEMRWLHEVVRWPVAWSASHGIAEMKTPLFRLCTETPATSGNKTLAWAGREYPSEGPRGVVFPYAAHLPVGRELVRPRLVQMIVK